MPLYVVLIMTGVKMLARFSMNHFHSSSSWHIWLLTLLPVAQRLLSVTSIFIKDFSSLFQAYVASLTPCCPNSSVKSAERYICMLDMCTTLLMLWLIDYERRKWQTLSGSFHHQRKGLHRHTSHSVMQTTEPIWLARWILNKPIGVSSSFWMMNLICGYGKPSHGGTSKYFLCICHQLTLWQPKQDTC